MAVQFLLVLPDILAERVGAHSLFQAEHQLDRNGPETHIARIRHNDLRGVLEDMRLRLLPRNCIFHDSLPSAQVNPPLAHFRVNSHKLKNLENSGVNDLPSIRNNADHDFLPRFRTPSLGTITRSEMCDVLDNRIEGA